MNKKRNITMKIMTNHQMFSIAAGAVTNPDAIGMKNVRRGRQGRQGRSQGRKGRGEN